MKQGREGFEEIKNKYKILNETEEASILGVGGFGCVYKGINMNTKKIVAIKKISKSKTDIKLFLKEINTLKQISKFGGHPQIVNLHDYYEDIDNYYIILDYIKGGEMFDQLVSLGTYSEADASNMLRQVARALVFLHCIGVVHSDLKPEHLMLNSSHKECEDGRDTVIRSPSSNRIKIVDFGSAEFMYDETYDIVGLEDSSCSSFDNNIDTIITPAYAPPEVLIESQPFVKRKLPSTDMWSVGIIVYVMLTCVHPFDVDGICTNEEIATNVINYKDDSSQIPLHNSNLTKHLSESAIDLIEQLLSCDYTNRLTAKEMLEHPWIIGQTAKTDTLPLDSLLLFRKYHSHYEATIAHFSFSIDDDEEEDNGGIAQGVFPINHYDKNKQLRIMKTNSYDIKLPLRNRLDTAPY